jgi:4-hydroxy-tetrahydrodipicolinate synthase
MIPLVTHYNRDLTLDLGAYKEYVQYLITHGVQTGQGCLLVAGAGGDFPMLTVPERITLARTAMEITGGRTPIVFSAQGTDIRTCRELAHIADDVGAFAYQVSPPFYFHPSDEDVVNWYRQIDSSSKKAGIMVYNTFWEGYHMPYQVLDQLVSFDRVVSLKWSTPNGGLDYLKGVGRYAERIAIIDNELTWPVTAMAGGAGFISHLASIMPEHEVELFHLTRSGKYKEALDSMRAVDWPWAEFRGEMASRTAGEAPPVKAALELCGKPGGPSRPPSRALNREERVSLRQVLVRIGAPVV